MTLLERETQLLHLDGLVADALRGNGRVAVLLGEAGAGKTALTEAFASRLAGRMRVLRGACEDLSIPDALGPLYDLARDAQWSLTRSELGEASMRIPLFSQALDVFGVEPSLIIIEDLHWADDATLDLVRFLGRRIANRCVLMLLTARNDGSDGQKRVRRALADIPTDRLVRIDVPLLSEAAVATLADQAGQDGRALFSATAGNAFYVTECLRSDGLMLPPGVRDAVLARVERLPDAARHVLDAVSIFPRVAEAAMVAKLCDLDDEGVATCLSAAILEDRGHTLAFRHEIARRAVEMAMSPGRHRALNAALLALLRGQDGVPMARLVHHAREAGDVRAVRELAPEAAHQASRAGAHRQAAGYYALLLEQADSIADISRAALNESYAFECHVIGRMGDAIAAQVEARKIHHRLGDRLGEGGCLRWLSRLSYLSGDREAADRHAIAAVAALEPAGPSAILAMAYSNRSQLAMLEGQSDDAVAFGTRAIAMAEHFNRPDIVCHALNNMGTSLYGREVDAGRAHLDRSLAMARDGGFDEEVARIYTNRGCVELEALCLADAGQVFSDGVDYCRDRDLDTWRDYMLGCLARVRLHQGRWDEAGTSAFAVVANEQATPLMRFHAVASLARLRLRRGDPDAASLVDELTRYLDKGLEFPRLALYACIVAEQAWLDGRDAGPALGLIAQAEARAPDGLGLSEIRMWQHILSGDKRLPQDDTVIAPYRQILAGDWRQAAEICADLGMPYERGLALLMGDAAAQGEAVSLFDHLGARIAAQRAREQMRQSGAVLIPRLPRDAVRQAGGDAFGDLTAREKEVLQLIARGQSNKDIARGLSISPKTVDHHVSAVLRKLDAASRSQAAAVARDAGWA